MRIARIIPTNSLPRVPSQNFAGSLNIPFPCSPRRTAAECFARGYGRKNLPADEQWVSLKLPAFLVLAPHADLESPLLANERITSSSGSVGH
jgi:hypothetical protein